MTATFRDVLRMEERALSRAFHRIEDLILKNTELATKETILWVLDNGIQKYDDLGIMQKKKLARTGEVSTMYGCITRHRSNLI